MRTRKLLSRSAIFCRGDIGRVVMALSMEFAGQDHPLGREVERISETLVKRCVRLINAGRRTGSIPPGPPARAVALALQGALEGTTIALAGHTPHDELPAARAVAGVLGIDSHRAQETPSPPATSLLERRC